MTRVARLEGGQMLSPTLRRIFREHHGIDVGLYSYGGCFDLGRITGHTNIGRYCSFAEGVCILNRNHPLKFKSTHPYFFNTALGYVNKQTIPFRELVIGNDVWVGRNAIILPSVCRIGDGAVIGAGTVVTTDVPDYAVVVGNPGRVVKYRFTEATIKVLRDSRWWEKDIEELGSKLDEFLCPVAEAGKDPTAGPENGR